MRRLPDVSGNYLIDLSKRPQFSAALPQITSNSDRLGAGTAPGISSFQNHNVRRKRQGTAPARIDIAEHDMHEATSIVAIVADLERVLRSGAPEQRAEIMRRVTDLFLTTPAHLSSEQIFLFDDIIRKLTLYLEQQALAELGVRIATAPKVPPELLRRFASDNAIELAGPILARSEGLTEKSLIEIAKRKSQLHLAKIATRRQLGEPVTDVLVDRGDRAVLNNLAANYGARFSRLGMRALVMRANGDDELISIIAQRDDIPTTIFRQLLTYATEQTRQHLVAMTSANADDIGSAGLRKGARVLVFRRSGHAGVAVAQEPETLHSQHFSRRAHLTLAHLAQVLRRRQRGIGDLADLAARCNNQAGLDAKRIVMQNSATQSPLIIGVSIYPQKPFH